MERPRVRMRVGFVAMAAATGLAVTAGLRESNLDMSDSAAPTEYRSRAKSHAPTTPRIEGVVLDGDRPVAEARVRIRGQRRFTKTDRSGRFSLPAPVETSSPVVVAAWKAGYFIGGAEWATGRAPQPANGGDRASLEEAPLRISLTPLPERDNPHYGWVDPTPDPGGIHNCGNCHEQIYNEWSASGHAHAAKNRRFLNLYDGADWRGRPGHGWSLLDEHPHGAGVCAACHAPTLDFGQPGSDDLRQVEGVAAHGVHCDFCHKVQDVDLSHVGLTHGRFGMKLLRPHEGQLFFGPLDDVTRDEDVYSPLQQESRYCAACHEGVVFGVHVYSTYSEWLESPARRQGQSCQSCHMTPTGRMTNIAPGAGGVERDPKTLASHSFLPGGREAMLRRCLNVDVDCRRNDEATNVRVTITAHDVGHRTPTGFIDRHLILVVEPVQAAAHSRRTDIHVRHSPAPDQTLPPAAGAEFAGKPGRLFAKLLADDQGRPLPFWRGAHEPVDTRLLPETPTTTEFRLPPAGEVRVRLLYRRFWSDVSQEKSWPDDTLVIYDRTWPAE